MKKDTVFKAVASNLGTSGAQLILGLVTSIVVTRTLGQEGKGFYNAALLLMSFYAPNILLGYRSGVLYEGLNNQLTTKRYFWTGLMVVTVLGSIGAILLITLANTNYLGDILGSLPFSTLTIVGIATVVTLLGGYCNSVLRIESMFHAGNKALLYGLVITCILQVGFFIIGVLDVYYALIGVLVGKSFEWLIGMYYIYKNAYPTWCIDYAKILFPFRYGIKAFTGNIIHRSNNQIDKIILSFLLLPSGFGIYSVGVGLANLMNKLPSSYLNIFFNQIAELPNDEKRIALFSRVHRINLFIGLVTFLLFFLFGKLLVVLMYGTAFIEAYSVLYVYAIGLIFYTNAKVIIKFYGAVGKPLKNSLIYFAGMILGTPFYFLLIPKYGVVGAAIASSVVYFFSYLFALAQVYSEFKISGYAFFQIRASDFLVAWDVIHRKIKNKNI